MQHKHQSAVKDNWKVVGLVTSTYSLTYINRNKPLLVLETSTCINRNKPLLALDNWKVVGF